ncbi:MAG TPA: hypothetical protein PKW55_08370 [Spirochaetota bacterium]|nr:hypothetical protein [Spirochaetota bacterium]HOM39001.1 hypothetical protein [Spirochaetota bacterium]HPQ49953.1 hypothetical protein [Spirochaetota bacterium]
MIYVKECKVLLEKFLEDSRLYYEVEGNPEKGLINYTLFTEIRENSFNFNIIVKDLFIVFDFLDFDLIYKAQIETIDKILLPEEIIEFFKGNIKFKVYKKNNKFLKLEVYRLKDHWEKILKKSKLFIKKPNLVFEFSIENFKKIRG